MRLSDRSTSRLVGWLFIGTFLFSIPGFLLYGPLLDDPDYVIGAGHDTQISLGAFVEILTAICNIGTAIALYPLAKRYSHRLAHGYVAVRILESTVIVAGIVSVLSVVTLRQHFAGADAASFVIAGQTLVAFHDWTMLLGPGFCAAFGTGLLLGTLMYRSGLMPRRVAALGLIGGSFAFVAATGALLGVYEPQSSPQILLTFPEMVWELTLGGYLIVKGFARPRGGRRWAPLRSPRSPEHPPAQRTSTRRNSAVPAATTSTPSSTVACRNSPSRAAVSATASASGFAMPSRSSLAASSSRKPAISAASAARSRSSRPLCSIVSNISAVVAGSWRSCVNTASERSSAACALGASRSAACTGASNRSDAVSAASRTSSSFERQ
jgi:hypothetical protein